MALRQAATRLGVGVGGRALQRARSSSPAVRTSTRGLTHDEKKVSATARFLWIELKKEQLYDLIAEGDQAPGMFGRNNAKLLKLLSQQIEPRPDDPRWRSCNRWAFANDCYSIAGAIFVGFTAADATAYLVKKVYPKEENNMALGGESSMNQSFS